MTNHIEKRKELFHLLAEVCRKALEIEEVSDEHLVCLETVKDCLRLTIDDYKKTDL